MMRLLAPGTVGVLSAFARANVLLAFDFDGTLAPIVAARDDAEMRKRTEQLFAKVCSLYTCAVISGRSRADVSKRLRGMGVKHVIGNHGLEPSAGYGDFEGEVARARAFLELALASEDVDVEDKRYSLALHYRRSRRRGEARAAIDRAIARLPVRTRVIPGKLVVNLVPEEAPNKGDALLSLRTSERADAALYVGDDITDEDVFQLDQPGRLLGVRVGESRTSRAPYFLRNQLEMDRLLERLVQLRKVRQSA